MTAAWIDNEIVDAEIVEEPAAPERRAPSTAVAVVPVRERVDLVVRRIGEEARARKHLVRVVLRFVLLALTKDVALGLWAWRVELYRWRTKAEDREILKASGKTPDKDLRDRIKQRTAALVVTTLFLALFARVYTWLATDALWATTVSYLQIAGVVALVLAFVTGHTWRAAGEPLDTGARQPGYDGSIDSVRSGLREAGVLKKPTKTLAGQNVWYIKAPERVGGGTQLYLRLDKGVAWSAVLDNIGKVGSALDFNSTFAVVEQIGNDSDVGLWMPDGDPFAAGPVACPLLDEDRWNAWEPAPFAITPHGLNLDLSLIGSNFLGGGKPGSGKTFSARPVLAPYILDPEVRIFTVNGKGDPAWEPLRDISVKYIRGAEPDQVWEFLDIIEMLIEEMKRRYAEITTSKVTEGMGYAPWLLAIDEVQEYLGSTEPTEMEARGKKKAPLGKVIDDRLTTLARLARAAGLIIVMLTQRPDDTVMSLALRSMFGTRFANKVATRHNSEMILGTAGPGTDASKLPAKYKGMGILVPDGETVSIEGTPLCRPYFVSDDDWVALGKQGYKLRRDSGTAGYLRFSEEDARPLPELLEQILEHVEGSDDGDRVPSSDLRTAYAPDMTEKAFGGQLRRWGAPTGRAPGNKGPSGPLVGDLRRVAQRIREGGKIEVMEAA